MIYGSQNIALLLGFLDLFAISIVLPHLAVNLKGKCGSAIAYGFFGTAYGILQSLGVPIFIFITAIQGRKKAIVLTFYLTGLAYYFLSYDSGLVYFFITRAVAGLSKHSQAMLKAYLSENCPKHSNKQVLENFYIMSKLGFICGPILGVFVYNFDQACIVACSIFMACAIIANLLLLDARYTMRHSESVPDQRPPSVRETVKSVDWNRLWNMFNGRFLLGLSAGIYQSNLGFQLLTRYALNPAHLGCVASFMGIVAIACDFLIAKVYEKYRDNTDRLLLICISCLTVSLILLGLTSSYIQTLLLLLFFQASSSFAAALELEMSTCRGGSVEAMASFKQAADCLIPAAFAFTPLLNGCLYSLHEALPAIVAASVSVGAGYIFYKKKR